MENKSHRTLLIDAKPRPRLQSRRRSVRSGYRRKKGHRKREPSSSLCPSGSDNRRFGSRLPASSQFSSRVLRLRLLVEGTDGGTCPEPSCRSRDENIIFFFSFPALDDESKHLRESPFLTGPGGGVSGCGGCANPGSDPS